MVGRRFFNYVLEAVMPHVGMESGLFVLAACVGVLLLKRKRHINTTEYHATPSVQSVNRLPSHVTLSAHASIADARLYSAQPTTSPNCFSLDGIWQFKLFRNVDSAFGAFRAAWDADVEATGQGGDPGWVDVQVPGHWQLQVPGDAPVYTNVKYIIPVDPPHIPQSNNPTGYFRRQFQTPRNFNAERRTILHFGGVDSAFYVWMNGKFAGFSKDSRLPAEFDVSALINANECGARGADSSDGTHDNVIEVIVIRYSDGYYLEDQDMFNLSGIFRNVFLLSLPVDVAICDFKWHTNPDMTSHVSTVDVDVKLKWDMFKIGALLDSGNSANHESSYLAQLSSDWVIKCYLFEEGIAQQHEFGSMCADIGDSPHGPHEKLGHTPRQKTAARTFHFGSASSTSIASHVELVPLPTALRDKDADGNVTVHMTLNVHAPTLWSAERPHLYTLVFALFHTSNDAAVVQAESCRLGFREISISNGQWRVNQRPIMIRGVNYHEHDPVKGHTVSAELLEADIKLMKRANFNAVRTSHYPQTPLFYELCSIYGLFVVDEANIETHGMKPYIGRLADTPVWEQAFMQRLTRMFERDKVHPCIIAWSLGELFFLFLIASR
jgi:beta-galactosidase